MNLSDHERSILAGTVGNDGDRMAMEIVVAAAGMLGADQLVPITSAHIDGCLYLGDSGVLFNERLVASGAKVKVPATTNVSALNLIKADQVRLPRDKRAMAFRLMQAHEAMGCAPSWTCAPYQAGMRPGLGEQVAWAESNAVAFVNSVLGARSNRYGDLLDIACAISARAPHTGLHRSACRTASLVIDIHGLSWSLRRQDAFYPVLGSLIGRLAGGAVCAVDGIDPAASDDQLKALLAGAASTGAVALVHIVGVTPEAPDIDTALGHKEPDELVRIDQSMILEARDRLSPGVAGPIDCVALGSPHFSEQECRSLLNLARGRAFKVPVYVCLGRHALKALELDGSCRALQDLGTEFVVDTCVVVTPILAAKPGVMMTNSAKFAHYAKGNTGYRPVFGTLADCVASAQAGHVIWDRSIWG